MESNRAGTRLTSPPSQFILLTNAYTSLASLCTIALSFLFFRNQEPRPRRPSPRLGGRRPADCPPGQGEVGEVVPGPVGGVTGPQAGDAPSTTPATIFLTLSTTALSAQPGGPYRRYLARPGRDVSTERSERSLVHRVPAPLSSSSSLAAGAVGRGGGFREVDRTTSCRTEARAPPPPRPSPGPSRRA